MREPESLNLLEDEFKERNKYYKSFSMTCLVFRDQIREHLISSENVINHIFYDLHDEETSY